MLICLLLWWKYVICLLLCNFLFCRVFLDSVSVVFVCLNGLNDGVVGVILYVDLVMYVMLWFELDVKVIR